jgi:hypothetical protein
LVEVADWSRFAGNCGLRRALAIAAVLAAAGCAGGGGSASSATTSGPLAGLSGKQVLTMAVGNLKTVPSFTVSGKATAAGGITAVDLGFLPGRGCSGTVSTVGKGSLAMVVIGSTAWVKPDDAYWKAVAGKQAAQAIATLGGKYLKGPTSNSTIAGLTGLCNLNSVTAQLKQGTSVVKGAVTTVHGTTAVPLTDTANGGTLYVTNTPSPLPIELVNNTAGKKGTLVFRLGATVSLTAPPVSDTVDAAKFGL